MTKVWMVLVDSMYNDVAPIIEVFDSLKKARAYVTDLHADAAEKQQPISVVESRPGVECHLFGDEEWAYLYRCVKVD